MAKVVSGVMKFAAVAVNFIPGIGQIASLAISSALTIGSSLLAPKSRQPANSSENAARRYASIDPNTPRKTAIGITAFTVDIR